MEFTTTSCSSRNMFQIFKILRITIYIKLKAVSNSDNIDSFLKSWGFKFRQSNLECTERMKISHKCCGAQHLCENKKIHKSVGIIQWAIEFRTTPCSTQNSFRNHWHLNFLAQMLSAKTFVRESEMKNSSHRV